MATAGTKTRAELIYRVIDQLGVLVPGQAPSAENVQKVDHQLDPTLALLTADDIVNVQDGGTPSPPTGGNIEDEIFLMVADCCAWRMAGSFNLVGDPALFKMNEIAEATLKRIGAAPRTRKTLRCDGQLSAGARTFRRFNYTTGQ